VDTVGVGMEVARLRRDAGLTQQALARRAGTTQAVISRLENGLKVPGYATLDRIAISLDAALTVTFGPTDEPTREERRRRVRAVIGDRPFDPWERDPAPAEQRSLIADGLDRGTLSSR
jgi:transcriptional regulator with XRE-family HTH domain